MKEISHQVEVHLSEYLLFCHPKRTFPNVRKSKTAHGLCSSIFIVFGDSSVAKRRERKQGLSKKDARKVY